MQCSASLCALGLVAVVGAEVGTVLGVLDGLFDLPVPERDAAAAHPVRQAWISIIGVLPAARRQRVGSALLRAFAVEAQERGCTFVAAMASLADDANGRLKFFHRCALRDLVAKESGDLVGAPIADVLAAIL